MIEKGHIHELPKQSIRRAIEGETLLAQNQPNRMLKINLYSRQISGLFMASQQITLPETLPIMLGLGAVTIHASATSAGMEYVGSKPSLNAGLNPNFG